VVIEWYSLGCANPLFSELAVLDGVSLALPILLGFPPEFALAVFFLFPCFIEVVLADCFHFGFDELLMELLVALGLAL
jgi:hypothetical protein